MLVVLLFLAFPLRGVGAAEDGVDSGCANAIWITNTVEFVAEVTRAPVPVACIKWASQKSLDILVASPAYSSSHTDAAAAFLPSRNWIILADNLDTTTAVGRSYLVHELVHAQQYARGAPGKATCIGSLEGEAYSLQARYLRRHGLKQEAFLFEMMGMLQSACGIDY
jgi:hypothetical protein